MPYEDLEKLPQNVKNVLPKHGQEIFQKAYNNAWDQYKDPKKRRGNESREAVSQKVAWSAVKHEYQKKGDQWVQK